MIILGLMLIAMFSIYGGTPVTQADVKKTHRNIDKSQLMNFDFDQARALVGKMSIEEKVGQLLMMPVPISWKDPELPKRLQAKGVDSRMGDLQYLKNIFQKYYVGGLIFLYRGTIEEQITTLRQFLSLHTSKIPLMVAQDLEPGLCEAKSLAPGLIALTDLPQLPCAARLGQMDDEVVYQAGKTLACQAKSLGVNVIFAPVVDVNSNPQNPIINKRAFGATAELVTQKASAFIQGVHSENVKTVLKHFPGHGDTVVDSHYQLPCIEHDMNRLQALELVPFQALITQGATGVMVAHLIVRALDTKIPASISADVINFLKQHMGFKGLIFTDAMDMKALERKNARLLPEVQAVLAGAHIIVVPYDVEETHRAIIQAIQEGLLTESQLDQRVTEIVAYKLSLEFGLEFRLIRP